jgi:hypothetical protein
MARFEDFLPEVMPYVPNCPEIVAVSAIRDAAIEFCRKSLWLIYEHDPINTVANQSAYELSLPTDTEMAAIWTASLDTIQLAPVGEVDASTLSGTTGIPMYITQIDTFNVRLVPTPYLDGSVLQMFAGIMPTRTSVTCDDQLSAHWAEQIGYGARARLHDIPGQPFTSPEMAMKYRAMFSNGMGEAKIERNRGLTRATMRVIPPRFI